MIDPAALIIVLSATVLSALIPGQDFFYVASHALGGRARGLVAVGGILTGLVFYVLAMAFGLGPVFAHFPVILHVIKFLGAGYLLYLSYRMSREALRPQADFFVRAATKTGTARVFFGGILINLLNPKTAIYFISFLPQFVDENAGPAATQIMLLGFPAIVTGCAVYAAEVLLIARYGSVILNNPRFARILYGVLGGLFFCLALGLLFSRL